MAIGKFFREEAWAEARSQLTHAGLLYLLPLAGGVVTFISGLFGGSHAVPLPYLFAASGIVFMTVAVGTHYGLKLMFERNPEGKFAVGGFVLGKVYEDVGNEKRLAHVKYCFVFKNSAMFPMGYLITPVRVSLGASINPRPVRDITGGTAPMGAEGMFTEAGIPVTDAMKGQLVEGEYLFDLTYGHPHRLNHTMRRNFKVTIKFDDKGEVETYDASVIG